MTRQEFFKIAAAAAVSGAAVAALSRPATPRRLAALPGRIPTWVLSTLPWSRTCRGMSTIPTGHTLR